MCSRCGLLRPEKFGGSWRCGCCGLPEGSVANGRQTASKAVDAGSSPATPANPAPEGADLPLSLAAERRLWSWWWVDVPRNTEPYSGL